MPSWSSSCSSERSICFRCESSRIAVSISVEPAIRDSYGFQWNARRASCTSAGANVCSFPLRSRTSNRSCPSSPCTATISNSAYPPTAANRGLFTFTRRPVKRRQSATVFSGRSIPGDETSSTYRPSIASGIASSRASMARDTFSQSPTVTFWRSRLSIRTSRTGRPLLPPTRSSTRSKPSESSSATTICSSACFTLIPYRFRGQKNVGRTSPTSRPRPENTPSVAQLPDNSWRLWRSQGESTRLSSTDRSVPLAPHGGGDHRQPRSPPRTPGRRRAGRRQAGAPRGPGGEEGGQIHVASANRVPAGELLEHRRADLVTTAADRGAEMDCQVGRVKTVFDHARDSLLHYARRGPAPAGMEQCDRTRWMRDEDRDAVGDGHRARDAGDERQVAIRAVVANPARRANAVIEERRAVHLPRAGEHRNALRHLGLKCQPARDGLRRRFAIAEPVVAGRARGGERLHAERLERVDLLPKRNRLGRRRSAHARPASTRLMCAPSAVSRSSMRSYPRSIWPTLLIVLLPFAQSAAISIAIPARMSGDSTVAPCNWLGPATSARCGSQSTMRAPMPTSLSTKKSRDSNIFSCMSTMPEHCVAVTMAIDMTSAGNAGQG